MKKAIFTTASGNLEQYRKYVKFIKAIILDTMWLIEYQDLLKLSKKLNQPVIVQMYKDMFKNDKELSTIPSLTVYDDYME